MNLENKNIIITGSTRGIGKDIAIKCLENKSNIIIHGTKQEKVDIVVKELKEKYQPLKTKMLNSNLKYL